MCVQNKRTTDLVQQTFQFHIRSRVMKFHLTRNTRYTICESVRICNHTHSSPIWEIIVLSNNKIVQGEAEYNFSYCVYNYFPNWTMITYTTGPAEANFSWLGEENGAPQNLLCMMMTSYPRS